MSRPQRINMSERNRPMNARVEHLPINCAWWHQTAPVEPLQALRSALSAIEAGEPLPGPVARVFAGALRQYLSGAETDLTKGLGLRPRKGGAAELPTRLERSRARNAAICRAFALLPGLDGHRAEHLASLTASPPTSAVITEAELSACIEQLHQQYGGDLPTSGRQILRIVRGQTVDARRR
jgi:hypothetical protein